MTHSEFILFLKLKKNNISELEKPKHRAYSVQTHPFCFPGQGLSCCTAKYCSYQLLE